MSNQNRQYEPLTRHLHGKRVFESALLTELDSLASRGGAVLNEYRPVRPILNDGRVSIAPSVTR